MSNRKACREGHFECIGVNAKDDRCFRDPSRCEKRGHEYAGADYCQRCGSEKVSRLS
jgi:hypothetical protein